MRSSTRFKRFKSWIGRKFRKLFKLQINEAKPITFCLSKKFLLYPPRSSFPGDVLVYMKRNATAAQALKLMQVCKYFCYLQFPYFLVTSVIGNFSQSQFPGWLIFSIQENNVQRIQRIDNTPNNLWITELVEICSERNVISELMPKIAYCGCSKLILIDQTLLLDEYEMFTVSGKVVYLDFDNTCVKYANGELVSFEKFFKTLPNIVHIHFERNCAPSVEDPDDLMRLVPLTLKFITLQNPAETYNYSTLFHFIELNDAISYHIKLSAPQSLTTLMGWQKLVNKLVKCNRSAVMNLLDNFNYSETLYILVPSK